MPIVQISRIQHRRGKATDLPQLAAGELGWVIDDQKLYIGNGTLADGAPNIGNTEIVTTGSSAFGAALKYLYHGYLGDPGLSGEATQRTLQTKLDERVSVKDFGAKGDGSTDDVLAINKALEKLYRHTDKTDVRSRRILFFPAGQYNITAEIKIPPYAHLVGEGQDKTILHRTGSGDNLAVTVDNAGQGHGSIGNSSAVTPRNISLEGITFRQMTAKVGLSIDSTTNLYARNCKWQGTYASGGADASGSKAITNRSTTALTSEHIVFDQCTFTKYARLVDLSHDITSVRFRDCKFSTAFYGARLGQTTNGSSNGLITGPRNIQFLNSNWSDIGQNAISVLDNGSIKNIVSFGNWYAKTVGNNFEGVGSIREVPVVEYNADECESIADYFERTDLRRTDNSSELNIAPEVQGIGKQVKAVKQISLVNNQSSATTTTLEFPAGSTSLGKSIVLNYKIERGSNFRVGTFTICASSAGVQFDDNFTESASDVGVELTATIGRDDSTSLDKTVIVKYTTTNTGAAAKMDVEVETLV
tara:strand:- start:1128 stop:2720 length:1593 start_codon:yes stop_codon:yes gene_type:complete